MNRVARLPGLVVTDHEFSLPLDYQRPEGDQIIVFGREVVASECECEDLPWLVFFQGGPGFGALRPESKQGWLKRALQEYRVFLLDQRGTGRSTPVTHQSLAGFKNAQAQADYLKNFRADAIVRDAEQIRRRLLGEDEPWSALGQSYGGFCIAHYLSAAPAGLKEAIITGGLPPLERPVDDVYRATYRRVSEQNRRYYDRYPEDVTLVQDIVAHLSDHEISLPGGGILSPRRFQQLGLAFGMSDGFEKIHYLLENAFIDARDGRTFSYTFLRDVENSLSFETHPIFAILHEPLYCQETASNWSAERVRAAYPEFEIKPTQPVYFTGEMIYSWMFDDYRYLHPLKEAAELLAAYEGWPRLYDLDVLKANTVPCAAAVYAEDMYVEHTFSEEAAQTIKGIKTWLTNEYMHNGLRADGARILNRLLSMLRGQI